MSHTVRCAFVAFPLGLLLAGCSGGHRAEFRRDATSSPSARTTGQAAARGIDRPVVERGTGPTSRPDQLFGYTIAPDSRYDITLNEFREHVRNGTAVIIDARGSADFSRGHIRGAINMPAGNKEAHIGQIHQHAAPDQFIIIYCNGPNCDAGDMVYDYLASQGFTNMRVFKPGWETLSAASDLR